MPLPFSDGPTSRAGLACVGRFHEDHVQPGGFGLVGHKVPKLPEGPAVQPSPDPLPGLDIGADVGQVFHADFAGSGTQGFGDDGFAGFVVDMANMPFLAPGDSLEFALSGAATVGLETTAMGKVNIPVVPEFPATPDLASAGCSEVILANIDPANAATRTWWGIGKIEDEVEIPDSFADNEPRLFGDTACKQIQLMLPGDEENLDAPRQSEQRQRIALKRIGALVEADRCGPENDCRNGLVLGDSLVGLECLVGISNTMDGLANHLTAERRKSLAHRVVGEMVQSNAVPTPMLPSERHNGVAGAGIGVSERGQSRRLIGSGGQLEIDSSLHIGHTTQTGGKSQHRLLSSPCLKAGVSRRH